MAEDFETVAARVEKLWPFVNTVAMHYKLSQALLEAVIHEESGGDPDAFPEHPERAGASFGLMQLLLPTARAVGYSGVARLLFDAERNIDLGARYLLSLLQQWGSDAIALVAYNGGPRAAWLAKHNLPAGPAARYSRNVLALRDRYAARNKVRDAAPNPLT